MKLRRWRRLIVYLACLVLVVLVAHLAREWMAPNEDDISAGQRESQARAEKSFKDAISYRHQENSRRDMRTFSEASQEHLNALNAAQGQAFVLMVEMAAANDSSSAALKKLYDQALAMQGVNTVKARRKILPFMAEFDAENDWALYRGLVVDSGNVEGFKALIKEVENYQGESGATRMLQAFAGADDMGEISREAAKILVARAEYGTGTDEAIAVAREMVRSCNHTAAGVYALQYACDAIVRLRGDVELLIFLEDCRGIQSDGPVREAVRARLATYYLRQDDPVAAVAAYCTNVEPDALLTLGSEAIEGAVDTLVNALKRDGIAKVSLIARLANIAAEEGKHDLCKSLYRRAAFLCHPLEVASCKIETEFEKSDEKAFWRAYLLWHGGSVDEGQELYDELLARYNQGWQVGQMMYDTADRHRVERRHKDAVDWAEKAAEVLPKNGAVAQLLQEAQQSLAEDERLITLIADLQKKTESDVALTSKAEYRTRLAEAHIEREDYDRAVNEFSEVWQNYPETFYAPKAMLLAGQTLYAHMGNRSDARGILVNMVLKYPTSEFSPQAFDLLKRIEESM